MLSVYKVRLSDFARTVKEKLTEARLTAMYPEITQMIEDFDAKHANCVHVGHWHDFMDTTPPFQHAPAKSVRLYREGWRYRGVAFEWFGWFPWDREISEQPHQRRCGQRQQPRTHRNWRR